MSLHFPSSRAQQRRASVQIERLESRVLLAVPVFEDDFNRPDAATLGADWIVRAGGFAVQGMSAVGSGGGSNVATANGVSLIDASVTVDVQLPGGASPFAGAITRYAGPGNANYYLGMIGASGGGFTAQIWRNVGGAFALLQSVATPSGTGRVRSQSAGNAHKLFVNDQMVAYAYDSSLTVGGGVGIDGSLSAAFDNVSVEPSLEAATLPFTDPLDGPNGTQLDRRWREHGGNFTISSNVAVGAVATVSLAALNGVSAADVSAVADITLPAGDVSAGLMARHSGPGATNV
jgi:hypothetical protein